MDREYETMFRRLMHERNELRKYIIDICKLLDIDTSQFILGANCLEFYAVLSSTAKDKIRDLQAQLKRKEQEYEKLADFIRKTDIYKDVACQIRDEILIYPSISGRKSCTDNEADIETLIAILARFEELQQECERYKNEINKLHKIMYCYVYEKGCHKVCKQQNCVIKNGYRCKQALDDIEKYLDAQQKYFDGEDYHNLLDIINKAKDSK